MSNELVASCNEIMETLKKNHDIKELFIFDKHKYAYAFIFDNDMIKNSPAYRKFVLPADKYSVVDIVKALDTGDKVAMYNSYVYQGWITLQVLIQDKTILNSLDLTDNDIDLSGLLN